MDNFELVEALSSLRLAVVQLEALTHAAAEAVTQLPFPSKRDERRLFDRVYALVTKAADETTAAVALGDELIAAVQPPSGEPGEKSDGSKTKR